MSETVELDRASDPKAVRGYAVFKGEKGYQFAVSLGNEGVPTRFTISDSCPKDLYSLDYIKVFAWSLSVRPAIFILCVCISPVSRVSVNCLSFIK